MSNGKEQCSMKQVNEVAEEIGEFCRKLGLLTKEHRFTDEGLKQFESYLNTQESVGPLLDPSAFTGGPIDGFRAIEKARNRVNLIRTIKKVLEMI